MNSLPPRDECQVRWAIRSASLYEHEIAAVQPITDMNTFKKCTENCMFKSVRVNLSTLLTFHYHSLSLFLSHEEVWSLLPQLGFPDGQL